MSIGSAALAEFEQILLSNSGEDAFESAIKLLAAKLLDELQSGAGESQKFTIHRTPEETYREIQKLFEAALSRWPLLDASESRLDITPPHLVRAMRPLLGWRLHDSDFSSLDATLERLVSRGSKGALGQYFTPRDIVRMCVDILNPRADELVMDPACGSGGFLFEAVHHAHVEERRPPACLGIDFSPKSLKVATLLSATSLGASIKVSKGNSLDGRAYSFQAPAEWESFLVQNSGSNTKRANTWGAWNRLGCDVLLTNPPFAGDIDELEIIDAYESQQSGIGKRVVSREHLFLERAVDLLRPGGRLAIVLPQGILANTTAAYLRTWLFKKCRILGVIGLHQHAFLPYTGVKTAVLMLSKPTINEALPEDYPILFAVSQTAGKDGSGRVTGSPDYPAIVQEFKGFLAEQGLSWANKSNGRGSEQGKAEIVMFSEVARSGRLDAEHYDPATRQLERRLANLSSATVANVVESKVPRFKKKQFKDITYIDISSVDNRTGIPFPSTIPSEEAPSRATYLVAKGDVLVSTVRPERNVVAMLTSDQDPPAVASNGFCVLRPKEVPPEVLFAYCRTEAFRKILTMHSTASMYPTVGEKDVLSTPFLPPPDDLQQRVVELIRSGLEMIEQAQAQIREAVSLVDAHVTGTTRDDSGLN